VLQAYSGFANIYSDYEENNTRFYTDNDNHSLIM
jgi:hypothetical protein